jgi:adenylyl- and sulfurtransferase ThiI
LVEHGVDFSSINTEWGRIFIETTDTQRAADVASRVFGIVSSSPVVVTTADMESIFDVGEKHSL